MEKSAYNKQPYLSSAFPLLPSYTQRSLRFGHILLWRRLWGRAYAAKSPRGRGFARLQIPAPQTAASNWRREIIKWLPPATSTQLDFERTNARAAQQLQRGGTEPSFTRRRQQHPSSKQSEQHPRAANSLEKAGRASYVYESALYEQSS